MAQRRQLLEEVGKTLNVDPDIAEEFVFGAKRSKAKPAAEAPVAPPEAPATPPKEEKGHGQATNVAGRVGLTTRIRSDYATALKRASLERQLQGVKPSTLQDILEEALQPWLR
jgi:hypothetical protein